MKIIEKFPKSSHASECDRMSTLTDDEFIQLCEDELQVLNEIFPEDITDLRHSKYDKNGRYIPPRLSIVLTPQESRISTGNNEYRAKLEIELSKAYPFKIPDRLVVEASSKVMSNQMRSQLQESLIKLAERKADEGAVYLFDLWDLGNHNLYRIKTNQSIVDEIKQQFVEVKSPPPSKSIVNRRMSRVSLMAAQSIPTIQATVQGKTRTSTLVLLDCELLSQDSHLDALGFEQRLLVDQTCGEIYTGVCATFIPRSTIGLSDSLKKLHKFIESVHERLRNANTQILRYLLGL